MKVTCDREKLLKVFAAASTVAAVRSPKEILNNFKMIARDGLVVLQATNLELWLSAAVEGCEIQVEGEVLLPTGKVGQFLREAPDVAIVIDVVGSEVHLKTASGVIRLATGNPQEFPTQNVAIDGPHHRVSARWLLDAIKRTNWATDPDSSRYALGGMLLSLKDDGQIVMVGTDGRRLACVTGSGEAVEEHQTDGVGVIVPVGAARILSRVISDKGDLKVAATLNDITIQGEGVMLNSRLVEGRYPLWEKVIPRRDDWAFDGEVPVGALSSIVRQAAITADGETRGMDFEIKAGTLAARAEANSAGASDISMPVAYDGEPVRIKLDYRYVHDMLGVLDPGSSLRVRIKDSAVACLRATEGYEYVVMPMALDR